MESQRMANQVCGLCIRRREYCRLGGLPVAGDGTCDRHKYSAAHRPEINVPRMCMNCRRFRLRCEYVGGTPYSLRKAGVLMTKTRIQRPNRRRRKKPKAKRRFKSQGAGLPSRVGIC